MDYATSMLPYSIPAKSHALHSTTEIPAWHQPARQVDGEVILPELGGAARSLSENERVELLGKARAELLDWNSFLTEVRERNRGQPYYKEDLLSKIFAAYVHRLVGGGPDRGIAASLYRDAKDVLVKAYCAYPTFNDDWKKFVESYAKFPDLGVNKVQEQFVRATPAFGRAAAQIDLATKSDSNMLLLLEMAEIPKRVEHRYVIGLSTLMSEIPDPALRRQVEMMGMQMLLQMAPAFGMSVASATVVGAVTDPGKQHHLSDSLDSAIGFEFKLPKIEDYPPAESPELRLRPAGGGAALQLPVALLNPLGDIARLNIERRAGSVALKTGVRVGAKYLAALLPAIVLYRKMEGNPDFVRMLAASAIWMAGKKAVDATEAADLRSWDSLPRWIGTVEARVAPGVYNASLVVPGPKGEQETALGTITVAATRAQQLWQARVFSSGKAVLH
jgi:hypothetical protein